MHVSNCCSLLYLTSICVIVARLDSTEHALERWMSGFVPDEWSQEMFVHTYEGMDDMPAHVKQALLGSSLAVPIPFAHDSTLDAHLCEHRNVWPRGSRHVAFTLQRGAEISSQTSLILPHPLRAPDDTLTWAVTDISETIRDDFAKNSAESSINTGTLHLFIASSSPPGAVYIAAADVNGAPYSPGYLAALCLMRHNFEGCAGRASGSDAVAAMLGQAVTIPIRDGQLALGENQAIYAFADSGDEVVDGSFLLKGEGRAPWLEVTVTIQATE
jgi:thiamine phosphate synthase YjbQ (UPF0047 family)